MTNTAQTIIAAILFATTAVACNTAPDTDEPSDETIMIWERSERSTTNGVESRPNFDDSQRWDQMDDPGNQIADGVCACENDECEAAYVADNFGCGVCVLVRCGDDDIAGGCAASCDDDDTKTTSAPPPSPTNPVNDTVGEI